MLQRQDEELIIKLKSGYQNQSTEELLDIWNKNDRYSYRDEAFTAIHEILLFRNIKIPEQDTAIDTKKTESERDPEEKKEIIRGAACVISGILITIVWYLSGTGYVVLPTGLIVYGSYILINHQAMK